MGSGTSHQLKTAIEMAVVASVWSTPNEAFQACPATSPGDLAGLGWWVFLHRLDCEVYLGEIGALFEILYAALDLFDPSPHVRELALYGE